ncbi:MAG: hypothetical protein QM831_40570 [Kofleriaceae bacterium]
MPNQNQNQNQSNKNPRGGEAGEQQNNQPPREREGVGNRSSEGGYQNDQKERRNS